MAVGASYLTKIKRAVRTTSTAADISTELTDLVEECRADLAKLGVLSAKTTDETDVLILSAVKSYVRWKFAAEEREANWNMNEYMAQRDELRKNRDYAWYTITFTITSDGTTAIADAEITFNGETKETNSSGQAVFYYVSAGVNQTYIVEATGYSYKEVDLDVTATATVTVNMGA